MTKNYFFISYTYSKKGLFGLVESFSIDNEQVVVTSKLTIKHLDIKRVKEIEGYISKKSGRKNIKILTFSYITSESHG